MNVKGLIFGSAILAIGCIMDSEKESNSNKNQKPDTVFVRDTVKVPIDTIKKDTTKIPVDTTKKDTVKTKPIPKTSGIYGRIISETGSWASNATVKLISRNNVLGKVSANNDTETKTDSSGNFSFPGLAPGKYDVVASVNGGEFVSFENVILQNDSLPSPVIDTIKKPGKVTATLSIPALNKIASRTNLDPTKIECFVPGITPVYRADTRGNCIIPGIPEGKHALYVELEKFVPIRDSIEVKSNKVTETTKMFSPDTSMPPVAPRILNVAYDTIDAKLTWTKVNIPGIKYDVQFQLNFDGWKSEWQSMFTMQKLNWTKTYPGISKGWKFEQSYEAEFNNLTSDTVMVLPNAVFDTMAKSIGMYSGFANRIRLSQSAWVPYDSSFKVSFRIVTKTISGKENNLLESPVKTINYVHHTYSNFTQLLRVSPLNDMTNFSGIEYSNYPNRQWQIKDTMQNLKFEYKYDLENKTYSYHTGRLYMVDTMQAKENQKKIFFETMIRNYVDDPDSAYWYVDKDTTISQYTSYWDWFSQTQHNQKYFQDVKMFSPKNAPLVKSEKLVDVSKVIDANPFHKIGIVALSLHGFYSSEHMFGTKMPSLNFEIDEYGAYNVHLIVKGKSGKVIYHSFDRYIIVTPKMANDWLNSLPGEKTNYALYKQIKMHGLRVKPEIR